MTAQTPAQARLRAALAASAPTTATRVRDLIASARLQDCARRPDGPDCACLDCQPCDCLDCQPWPLVLTVPCPACTLPLDYTDQPHPCTDQDAPALLDALAHRIDPAAQPEAARAWHTLAAALGYPRA